MPFVANSVTTGTLGYKLKKDFLGDGLFYREVETYTYEIYARPSIPYSTPFADIETLIKNYFASRSGDFSYKVLESPADYQFPNNHAQAAKFRVEVELRNPVSSLDTYNPELTTNRYKGLDQNFFTSYGTGIDNFSEEWTFQQQDDGKDVFTHDISFNLYSGARKEKAQEIAASVFNQDANTTLGVNILGGTSLTSSGSFTNYYNESYDLMRNSYRFTRRREALALSGSAYTNDLSHSVTLKPDGVIDVTEKGIINGKLTLTNAQAGYDTLIASAYTRCNTLYSTYKDFVGGQSVSASLKNFPLALTRTFNKPALMIDYEVNYTSDPNIDTVNSLSLDKTIDVEVTEDRFININHSYAWTYLVPVQAGNDATAITFVNSARTASPTEIANYYTNSTFFSSGRPNMKLIKFSAGLPNRNRNFNATFGYTNNPIYFVTLDGETYAILDYKLSNQKPADIITEFKVINRPTKESVLNYAYQTERGTKGASVSARLQRTSDNMFTTPRPSLAGQLLSLYKFAVGRLLQDFQGVTVLALSYHLSDVKYQINSDNEITLDVMITYALKKYVA
jgi:hypothetical protein